MTNKTFKEEMIKEFRSKFSNPDGLTKIGYSTVDLRPLEDFWLEKLDLAVANREKEIVEMIEIEFPFVQQGEFISKPEKTFNEIRTKIIENI